ncbi:CheR family methyltransferase [Janthinobacterium sp. HH01]|uniref:CheR family methyltransferase n=1 Tax=Janthinobacterium sp. HH01 TaxID=1198452 RepID=UPI0005BC24F1|nr:CheR family methyltransferase [Janthinobacterium sp. HH01]
MYQLFHPVQPVGEPADFTIVGLGASAGGLKALISFFKHLQADCDMVFVVILHLSPDSPSNVSSILQRTTHLPVTEVTESRRVEPGNVYVIAPNRQLSMSDGMLTVTDLAKKPGSLVTINYFFRSMARAYKQRCVGVLLSGTGSDGAQGMFDIRAEGGLTIAQHPDDAEHAAMPAAAIRAEAVDFILSAVEMPGKLLQLRENARGIRLAGLSDSEVIEAANQNAEQSASQENALREIIATLQERTGHDFNHYKRATVLRRLERRLQVRSVQDLLAYRDVIRADPAESDTLLKDLLIGVTQFFRDRETFEVLERDIIPALFADREAMQPVRLWVAASSTGEEAYSLGMLLSEQAGRSLTPASLQIFATDIDERAIAVARAGVYAEESVDALPEGMLPRYFDPNGRGYRIKKQLREHVSFALHNLLRDPPFSRLDMISCRNLLIYLDREAQTRILETFHFALKPDGVLLLGNSESADMLAEHFVPIDKKNRIYRAKANRVNIRVPTVISPFRPLRQSVRQDDATGERNQSTYAGLHDRALAATAEPSLIVNGNADIIHMTAEAGKFLRHAGGEPSRNVLSLVVPELRLDLRTVLFQVEQSGERARIAAPSLVRDGKLWDVEICATPYLDEEIGEKVVVVLFEERPSTASAGDTPRQGNEPNDAVLLSLEKNLQRTTARLQDTIEQAEASAEELKASNEELQAINEELRSASEELEIGKEELQSLNAELQRVNQEMQGKVDETSKANDDLQNLIVSSDVATLFVDREMRVQRYTPRTTDIFNIIPGDLGRLLAHITHNLEFDELASDAARTFETLRLVEREVRSLNGGHYIARMLPYRTLADRIEGALLTFIDVTELRRAEERLRAADARMRLVAASTMDYAIITLDTHGMITSFNKGAERMYGYHEGEVAGQSIDLLYTPEDRDADVPGEERQRAQAAGRAEDERWHVRKDGGRFFCSGVITPLQEGQFQGYAKIGRDLTGRVEAEKLRTRQLSDEQRKRAEAQAANNLKDEFLAIMSHELRHPLNLIHLNAELLRRLSEANANPSIPKAVRAILAASVSQAKIIDDLLDFSRINTGKLALVQEDVNLCELVKLLLPIFEADQTASGLRISCEPEHEVWAFVDAVRVNQIIGNLLSNAIKFSRPDGSIVIRIEQESNAALIEVMDDGQGIAPEALPTIFDMFKQSQLSTTRSNTGLGIGLTLVKQIVDLHGGSVEARSDGLGRGARFIVRLPLARGIVVVSPKPVGGMLSGLRILIVDDSPDVVETFKMLLELEGVQVHTALSGIEALKLVDDQIFDVIISDIGMPEMNGYGFMRQVRSRPTAADIPTIALTGFGRHKDIELAHSAGFTSHLSKPASVEQLVQAIVLVSKKRG